jgi:hypothetical protein
MADIRNATDYTPIKLDIIPQHGTGTPVAIHQIMTEMHIFEDMYKPFLTGTLAFMAETRLSNRFLSTKYQTEVTQERCS